MTRRMFDKEEGKKENIADCLEGNDPYVNMCAAIAITAVEDYVKYMKKLKKDPNDSTAKYQIKLIKKYIREGLFIDYCNIDPENFIKRLESIKI